MKNISLLIISTLMLLLFFSCKSNEIIQQLNPTFTVVESSFSKIVAGEQGELTKIELTIVLNNLPENIVFDSILFKGNTIKIIQTKLQKNITQIITSKVNDTKANVSNYKSLNIDFNHAIIFYSIGKKKYFYHIKSIKEKESIYMPIESPENRN